MSGRYLLAPAGILLAALSAWLAFWGSPAATGRPRIHYSLVDLDIPARLLPPLLLLVTAAATLCIVIGLRMLASPDYRVDPGFEDKRPWRGATLVSALAPVAAVAIVAAAAVLKDASVPEGSDERATALVLLLGAGGLIALITLVAALASGKSVGVESQWSGLGGAIGGWKVSSPAVTLLVFLACFGGMVAVIAPPAKDGNVVDASDTPDPTNSLADQTPKDENAVETVVQNERSAGGVARDENRGKMLSRRNENE